MQTIIYRMDKQQSPTGIALMKKNIYIYKTESESSAV